MSESKDLEENQNLLKLAQKVNLDKDDLKAIKKSKEHQRYQYLKIFLFSFFMGLMGGWIYLGSSPTVENSGYPYTQLLIGVNLASPFRISRVKNILLILSTIFGFVSGGVFGSMIPRDTVPWVHTVSLYGVYSNQGV